MGACANGRQFGIGSLPARKGVTHGIFADIETGFRIKLLEPGARAHILFGENNPRDRRRWRVRESGESFQFPDETWSVDR